MQVSFLYFLSNPLFTLLSLLTHPFFLSTVKDSYTVQFITKFIRSMREYENTLPTRIHDEVRANGDLFIGGFFFPKSIYTKSVPITCDWLHELFCEICKPQDLELVTNLKNSVKVNKQDRNFVVNDVSSETFVIIEDISILEKITAIMDMCRHGMGFGAMRNTENERLGFGL